MTDLTWLQVDKRVQAIKQVLAPLYLEMKSALSAQPDEDVIRNLQGELGNDTLAEMVLRSTRDDLSNNITRHICRMTNTVKAMEADVTARWGADAFEVASKQLKKNYALPDTW